jgi:hypothetical protein
MFRGKLVEGVPRKRVQENLMRAFKIDAKHAETILSSQDICLKRCQSAEDAFRFSEKLQKVGLSVVVARARKKIAEAAASFTPVKPVTPSVDTIAPPLSSDPIVSPYGNAKAIPARAQKVPDLSSVEGYLSEKRVEGNPPVAPKLELLPAYVGVQDYDRFSLGRSANPSDALKKPALKMKAKIRPAKDALPEPAVVPDKVEGGFYTILNKVVRDAHHPGEKAKTIVLEPETVLSRHSRVEYPVVEESPEAVAANADAPAPESGVAQDETPVANAAVAEATDKEASLSPVLQEEESAPQGEPESLTDEPEKAAEEKTEALSEPEEVASLADAVEFFAEQAAGEDVADADAVNATPHVAANEEMIKEVAEAIAAVSEEGVQETHDDASAVADARLEEAISDAKEAASILALNKELLSHIEQEADGLLDDDPVTVAGLDRTLSPYPLSPADFERAAKGESNEPSNEVKTDVNFSDNAENQQKEASPSTDEAAMDARGVSPLDTDSLPMEEVDPASVKVQRFVVTAIVAGCTALTAFLYFMLL